MPVCAPEPRGESGCPTPGARMDYIKQKCKMVAVSRKLMPMCVRPCSWTCSFTSLKKRRAGLEKAPLLLIEKAMLSFMEERKDAAVAFSF